MSAAEFFASSANTVQGGANGRGLGLVDFDLGHSTTYPDGSFAEFIVQVCG